MPKQKPKIGSIDRCGKQLSASAILNAVAECQHLSGSSSVSMLSTSVLRALPFHRLGLSDWGVHGGSGLGPIVGHLLPCGVSTNNNGVGGCVDSGLAICLLLTELYGELTRKLLSVPYRNTTGFVYSRSNKGDVRRHDVTIAGIVIYGYDSILLLCKNCN